MNPLRQMKHGHAYSTVILLEYGLVQLVVGANPILNALFLLYKINEP